MPPYQRIHCDVFQIAVSTPPTPRASITLPPTSQVGVSTVTVEANSGNFSSQTQGVGKIAGIVVAIILGLALIGAIVSNIALP